MTDTTLYDDDILTWSEQQAAALRSLSQRADLSNVVDWANVIEEIESLGRREWKGVESQIRNALRHILKGYCDPASLSCQAWSIEADGFLDEARGEFKNSMRQQIDVDRAWQRAFRDAARELRPYGARIPPGLPHRSPFTLDEILDPSLFYEGAVRSLHRSPNAKVN